MSTWLSATELAAMRAEIARTLPDVVVRYTPSWTADGAGGGTVTYTVAGTVYGRLRPAGFKMQPGAAAGAESFAQAMLLTLPYDAPLNPDDRVVVQGRWFEIRQIDRDDSWPLSVVATVTWVKP